MSGAAGLTALGVSRPVLIAVMNLLIMLAGLASLLALDVRELPDVDRPVVSVRAQFPGASPETVDAEVTSVLEGAVARVPGVQSIESASEENQGRMRVEFQSSVDLNDAANDVREAVSRVQRDLPEEIEQLLVIKADDDAEAIIQIAAYSDTLSQAQLAERIEKDVAPELLSIGGVADVRLQGAQPRVLRVLLDPARLASNRVSVSNVIETLRDARFDVPAGSYESEDQAFIVRAYASVVEPERIERLHVRENVRIEDLGEAFYSAEEATSYSILNGRMVLGLGVVRQAESNTIAIANAVDQRLARINERASEFSLVKTFDDSVYIRGALQDVLFTLAFAVLIVLLVIALFLGQWRAVLIPAVTMPVSLIGTLAAVWLFGFSINLLTLLALVLATGLIVDDAIVVLENIQRRRGQGLESMAAAVLGTRQVFFAVIATTLTLVAVFLPIAFLPGDTGRLFREFGLVLAITVVISSFVALTLCPMMASRLPAGAAAAPGSARARLDALGAGAGAAYLASLRRVLARPLLSLAIGLLLAGAGFAGFLQLDRELLPREDRGALRVLVTGPDGASIAYADRQSRKVEAVLEPYRERGLVTNIYTVVGQWDPHRAFTIATLAPWQARATSQMALAAQINDALSGMPGAQVRIFQGSTLGGRGGGSGLELALVGNEYAEILAAAERLSQALTERVAEIEDVRIDFNTAQPELYFNIDRERARDLDVAMETIADTLRVMVDRHEVVELSIEDQAVPIMLGSTRGALNDPGDLLNVFVPSEAGELVPLGALIDVAERGVATQLDRHAQRRAIEMDIGFPPRAPLGEAMTRIRSVADEILPAGVEALFVGEAARLSEASQEATVTFLLAVLVIFLVLAAQFENIGSAVIVMFTVPFGLAAAVFALLLSGQSINLYSQIGLVMLVGVMTKNAILLVEFMDQLRDAGHSVREAVIEGVQVRLRPVAMTVLSTVLGSLPLVLSTGPGAEARNAIGWVVFGGLGLSALFTLYFAPLGYSLIAPHLKPRAHAGEQLAGQLERAGQAEP